MTVVSQLVLKVGIQKVTCDCGRKITVRVMGLQKDNRGSYYPYRSAACRSCGTIHSGAKRTRIW